MKVAKDRSRSPFDSDRPPGRTIVAQGEALKSCPDTRPVGLGSCYPMSQNRDMGHPLFCGESSERQKQVPIRLRSLARSRSGQALKSCPDTRPVGLGSCYPMSQNRDMGHPLFCGKVAKDRSRSLDSAEKRFAQDDREAGNREQRTGNREAGRRRVRWSSFVPTLRSEKRRMGQRQAFPTFGA